MTGLARGLLLLPAALLMCAAAAPPIPAQISARTWDIGFGMEAKAAVAGRQPALHSGLCAMAAVGAAGAALD